MGSKCLTPPIHFFRLYLWYIGSTIQTEWDYENKIKSEYYRTFSKLNRIIYPGCPQVHHLTVVASNDKKKQNRKALFFFRYLSKGYVKNEDSLFRFRFTIRHSSLIFFSFFFSPPTPPSPSPIFQVESFFLSYIFDDLPPLAPLVSLFRTHPSYVFSHRLRVRFGRVFFKFRFIYKYTYFFVAGFLQDNRMCS